ncbi:MAG: glycerol-3-phosphate dehydrogenase [Hyphomonadaceae bacterium]
MYDILIIGGGINGAGIARDAAGRGLKVLLCEKDDLASHTSSSSTKLIHGGLRYLEHYDFALVRKALAEREVLLKAAPHIIWPMRFVLPHQKDQRPAWLVRIGLFIYDYMGGRKILPPTEVLKRAKSSKFDALKPEFKKAFEYSDCWVDDARLVVLNAVDAQERGAKIMTRSECVELTRHDDHWSAVLRTEDGDITVEARTVVNAAGPWVDDVAEIAVKKRVNSGRVRLVKGSHIVTRKLFEGDHAYFFQNGDGRIIFAIPYESGTSTLIGTTDVPFAADNDHVKISPEEIDYLCAAVSEYFLQPITPEDVTSTYSGVRPLYDDHSEDASEVTRDYVLAYNKTNGAPILSVYGGKITTFRKLSEGVLKILSDALGGLADPWTKDAPFPGGDIPNADFDEFLATKVAQYSAFPKTLLARLARAYGTRMDEIIGQAQNPDGLGKSFGGGLYEVEVNYLLANEFAKSADDVLLRRSKLGLHMTSEEVEALTQWLAQKQK